MKILRDTRITFVIALLVALVFVSPAEHLKPLLIPLLALSMFFSLINVKCFLPSFVEVKKSFRLLVVGYIVLSGVLIVAAHFLPNEDFKNGLIMYAAFPPAVMLVGLSLVWGGNVKMAFVGELISYIAGLVLTPLITFMFIGSSVPVGKLVELLVFIFIVPLFMVALMRKFISLEKWRCGFAKEAANIMITLVFYTIVAQSIGMIANNWEELLVSLVFVTIVSLGLIYVIYRYSKKDVDLVLFSSLKNGGAAAAASLLILTPGAALFLAARVLIDIAIIVFVGQLLGKK